MSLDLAPYDLIDEAFQEEEQQTLVLRLLQSAPEGSLVSEDDMTSFMQWLMGFQEARTMLGLVIKGVANISIEDGLPQFSLNPGEPHPSLEEMTQDAPPPADWLDQHMDPDAFLW